VDCVSDLGALSLDVDEDRHGLVVETLVVVVVTDLLANLSGDLLIVDGGACHEGLSQEDDLYQK
jgi:hypothetical protein